MLMEYRGFDLDKIKQGECIKITDNDKTFIMLVLEARTTKIKVVGIKVNKTCELANFILVNEKQYKPLVAYSLPVTIFNDDNLKIECV